MDYKTVSCYHIFSQNEPRIYHHTTQINIHFRHLTSSSACSSLVTPYFLSMGCEKAGESSSKASSTSMGLHFVNNSSACLASWFTVQLTDFRNLVRACLKLIQTDLVLYTNIVEWSVVINAILLVLLFLLHGWKLKIFPKQKISNVAFPWPLASGWGSGLSYSIDERGVRRGWGVLSRNVFFLN